MKFEPELFTFKDGTPVITAADWQKRRKEIVAILAENEFGITPPAPACVKGEVIPSKETHCCGNASCEKVNISFETERGEFTFPINLFIPKCDKPVPVMLLINFRPDRYDKYCPTEEIIDNGFALAQLYYNDITTDDCFDFDKLASMYDRSKSNSWGQIGIWAFAASRVIDYLVTRPEIDKENIAVVGHSRLGKTALWCGAQDERVKYTCSNDSGCAGAAYERIKHGESETLKAITDRFPFWFCENYAKYADKVNEMPFDQHFLIAACAPRYVCVNSASLDAWADPYSEQLSCVGASPAWTLCGKTGFAGDTTPVAVGECNADGDIAYHLRPGKHFLSRYDWNCYMKFIKSKM